ncbi:MAG: hypothetical protein ABIG90_02615 [bacterium]
MKHIFINTNEKLSRVLGRLKKETEKDIALIIPREAVILKNLDNLKKLKRKAKILKKTIKFISNDPRMKKNKKKIMPDRPKTKTKKKAKTKKISRKHGRLSSLTSKAFIIFLFCVLGLTSVSLYLILPRADIIIAPQKEPLAVDLNIIIDQNIQAIDLQNNKIPGELKIFEDQVVRRFEATGTKTLDAKARGFITVHNNSKSQVWREETRFEDQNGLIFKTLKFEKIPLGTREIEVVAENPGEEYNILPSTFTLPAFKERKDPQYSLIYGKSEKSMIGGIKQEIIFVSQDDISQAEETLKQEMRAKLKTEVNSDIFEEQILLQESSATANTQAQAFNINLKMSFNTLIFQEQDLRDLIKQNLLLRISEDKKLSGEPEINFGQAEFYLSKGQMFLPVSIKQEVVWKIEPDKFKKQLAGKNKQEVEYLLQRQAGIDLTRVSLWPFWVKKVPDSEDKIKIKIEQ